MLIQTKWNGIVSQLGSTTMKATFAAANTTHPTSTEYLRSQSIAGMADRLDRGVGAELLAQSPDADVDDVRPGVEAVPPDVREQALAAYHLAGVLHEMAEQPELAVGQVADEVAEASLPSRDVELEPAAAERAFV